MKKAMYLLLVMVVLLGMLPAAAEAKKGTAMYVSEVNGRAVIWNVGEFWYTVVVHVVDVHENPLLGARVFAQTDASSVKGVSAYTDENGMAEFFIFSTKGELTFTVENILKSGYYYDSALNLESSIYIDAPAPIIP